MRSRVLAPSALLSLFVVGCAGPSPTAPSASSAQVTRVPQVTAVQSPASLTSSSTDRAPASTDPRAGLEINYLEFVADHHLSGVKMAEICVDKAVHAELRADCQRDLVNQQAEIELVLDLLRQYYGIDYTPTLDGEGRLTQLERLSGSAFEIRFLEEFPRHHKTVIQRSEPLTRNAVHDEVRQLAENIIAAQTADAIRMVTWKCQWYGGL